jgi:hypothetical protein
MQCSKNKTQSKTKMQWKCSKWMVTLICLCMIIHTHAMGFEVTINPNQFDTLVSEAKTSFEAMDKTANKALLAVDSTAHFVTDSLIGTVDATMQQVRHAVLNVTDQMCMTAQMIQKSISKTADQINGELIVHTRVLLSDALSTVDRISNKLEVIANATVTQTTVALIDVIHARAVDIGKVIIGASFFFGFVHVISKLIPRMPHRAKFTDYLISFYPLSCLTIIVTIMLCIIDHICHYTEDSPATFQPLMIHLAMASNVVAVTNVYLYLVCIIAFNWDHEKLHILVKKKISTSINNEEDESFDLKDTTRKSKYVKQREFWWQYLILWGTRIAVMLVFTILLIASLFIIGYLTKRRIMEVKSRPDYHEYD